MFRIVALIPPMLPDSIRRLRPDVFVMALAGTVALATLLPCQGISAQIFHIAGVGGVATLFFLQGARLSREAIVAGMTNWKLHAAIAGTTFVLFPLMGSALVTLMPPHLFVHTLVLGVCSSVRCRPQCSRRSRSPRSHRAMWPARCALPRPPA